MSSTSTTFHFARGGGSLCQNMACKGADHNHGCGTEPSTNVTDLPATVFPFHFARHYACRNRSLVLTVLELHAVSREPRTSEANRQVQPNFRVGYLCGYRYGKSHIPFVFSADESLGATTKSFLAISLTGFEFRGIAEVHKYVVIDQMNPQNGIRTEHLKPSSHI